MRRTNSLPQREQIDLALTRIGFQRAATGGGCTAYIIDHPQGGQVWLTSQHGTFTPTHWSEKVLVCYYGPGDDGSEGTTLIDAVPLASAMPRVRRYARALPKTVRGVAITPSTRTERITR